MAHGLGLYSIWIAIYMLILQINHGTYGFKNKQPDKLDGPDLLRDIPHNRERKSTDSDGHFDMISIRRSISDQEADVMADILRHFRWTYVNIVNSDNFDSFVQTQELSDRMRSEGRCIARQYSVRVTSNAGPYDYIIQDIRGRGSKLATLLLTTGADTAGLLREKAAATPDEWLFVIGTGWHGQTSMSDMLDSAPGSLALRFYTPHYDSFANYMHEALTGPNAGWMTAIYEAVYNCSFDSVGPRCAGSIVDDVVPYEDASSKTLTLIHAFWVAMTMAANHAGCRSQEVEVCMQDVVLNEDHFYKNASRALMTEMGGEYEIINFAGDRASKVGRYENYRLALEDNLITWPDAGRAPPTSSCSEPCALGYMPVYSHGERCCWVCLPTDSSEPLLHASSGYSWVWLFKIVAWLLVIL